MNATEEFKKLKASRQRAGVYPTDADQRFFARKTNGLPRSYRVRQSEVSDDYAFISGEQDASRFITIVFRATCDYLVIPADTAKFGAVVNSDAYANFRLDALAREGAHAP